MLDNIKKGSSDVTAVMTVMTDGERPWVLPAIDSILGQTVLPDRIIIMAETNNTWIENDLRKIDHSKDLMSLVQIQYMPLARLGAVRNAGTRLAQTRWVAYLDGDDIWKPERLEWQLAEAAAHPNAQFIAGDYEFIDSNGRPFAYSNGSTPTPSSWLVSRDLMLQFPFDPERKLGEDHGWLIATKPHCERIRIPKIVTGYRIRGNSLSTMSSWHSRQRKVREAMSRASAYEVFRWLMLGTTYIRYLLLRNRPYSV